MPDISDFSELIADLLSGQDRLNKQMEDLQKENKDNADRTIAAFNSFAPAVLKRLDNIETSLTKLADVEERLGAEVFKK